MAEQRRHPRRRVHVEVRAHDAAGEGELLFESADLSYGGAFLVSDLLLEDGETLVLQLELPDKPRVEATARVAWVRRFPRPGELAGMGVQFLSMDDQARAELDAFLASEPLL